MFVTRQQGIVIVHSPWLGTLCRGREWRAGADWGMSTGWVPPEMWCPPPRCACASMSMTKLPPRARAAFILPTSAAKLLLRDRRPMLEPRLMPPCAQAIHDYVVFPYSALPTIAAAMAAGQQGYHRHLSCESASEDPSVKACLNE